MLIQGICLGLAFVLRLILNSESLKSLYLFSLITLTLLERETKFGFRISKVNVGWKDHEWWWSILSQHIFECKIWFATGLFWLYKTNISLNSVTRFFSYSSNFISIQFVSRKKIHVEFSTPDLVLYLNWANFLAPFLEWIKMTFWYWYFQQYIQGLFFFSSNDNHPSQISRWSVWLNTNERFLAHSFSRFLHSCWKQANQKEQGETRLSFTF